MRCPQCAVRLGWHTVALDARRTYCLICQEHYTLPSAWDFADERLVLLGAVDDPDRVTLWLSDWAPVPAMV
ncbi:hypothetical protein [Nocardia sp. XZ_19_385]|uniref:hypothetical protein n=1 Tax=Nocardia sp. XZ_19_385 TaxID=2769488 RepID=UPI0030DAA618